MILTDPADPPIDPVLVQAGAPSPSELCERRVLVDFRAGVERQYKTDPSLRDHPECRQLRRKP